MAGTKWIDGLPYQSSKGPGPRKWWNKSKEGWVRLGASGAYVEDNFPQGPELKKLTKHPKQNWMFLVWEMGTFFKRGPENTAMFWSFYMKKEEAEKEAEVQRSAGYRVAVRRAP